MSFHVPVRTFAALFLSLAMLPSASAAPPHRVRFQGRLTDNAGVPLNGTMNLQFEIFNAPVGGGSLWSEMQTNVPVDNGYVNVALGSVISIEPTVFDGSEAWLQVTVGSTVLTPRQQLTSVPYVLGRQTLDDGYDAGGPGAGRTITTDAGAVTIAGSGGLQVDGRVGIGTTSPNAPLWVRENALGDVFGAVFENIHPSGGAGLIIDRGGAPRAAQLQFRTAGSGEWYAGILRFGGSPTHRFAISSNSDLNAGGREFVINNGSVGIGTDPGVTLDILQSTALTRLTSSTGINRTGYIASNTGGNLYLGMNDSAGTGFISSGGLAYAGIVNVSSARALQFGTSDTARMTIDSSGNVGIGTTSPGEQLSLSAPDAVLSLKSTRPGGRDWTVRSGSGNGGNEDNFRITDKTGLVDRMVIDDAGNVGIGTTSPPQQLSLTGGIGFANNNAVDKKLWSPSDGVLRWQTHTGAPGHSLEVGHQTDPAVVHLDIAGNSWLTGGNVGIGTSTPTYKLEVTGTGGFNQSIYSTALDGSMTRFGLQNTARHWSISNDGTGTFFIADETAGDIRLRIMATAQGNTRVGIGMSPTVDGIDVNGRIKGSDFPTNVSSNTLCSNFANSGSIGRCGSTRRLKESIRDLQLPGVETTLRLRPREFNWKQNGSRDLGFIAEEVAEVAPLLAGYDEQGKVITVKYTQLTALLVQAIQEQQQQIDELRREMEKLKAGMAASR